MGRVRRGAGGAAGRAGVLVLRFGSRAVLALPRLASRAMLRVRDQPLSGFSDRQLRDIGLSRADVTRPHERSGSPELDRYRMLRGFDWR